MNNQQLKTEEKVKKQTTISVSNHCWKKLQHIKYNENYATIEDVINMLINIKEAKGK